MCVDLFGTLTKCFLDTQRPWSPVFCFTAVRNWTNRPTPTGVPLMGLVLLWVTGRVLMLTPLDIAAAVINAAFPAAVAVAIAVPLVKAGNARNYFFIGLLMLISALTLLLHFPLPQRLGLAPGVVLQLVLDVVLFIMAVVGGRVIPMFTNNAIPGARATRRISIERLALGSVIVLFVADLMQLDAVLVSAVAFAAALVHGARLFLWRPLRTLGTPLVWILHAAYAWIALHLALRGFAQLGWVLPSLATHALTIGAIGGLTIGMMTRTARGHTGRLVQADRYESLHICCCKRRRLFVCLAAWRSRRFTRRPLNFRVCSGQVHSASISYAIGLC